jgi:hypothetical protein
LFERELTACHAALKVPGRVDLVQIHPMLLAAAWAPEIVMVDPEEGFQATPHEPHDPESHNDNRNHPDREKEQNNPILDRKACTLRLRRLRVSGRHRTPLRHHSRVCREEIPQSDLAAGSGACVTLCG